MLPVRESNGYEQPVTALKFPVAASLRERYGELTWRVLKGLLGIFLLSSFFLVCFAVVVGQPSWRSPECINFFDEPVNASGRLALPSSETDGNATNTSHIFFGLGGSARTWPARRHYSELWWRPGVTRGFVWLEERPNFTWSDAGPPYRVSEDTSRFPYTSGSGTRSAVRLARILLESVRAREIGVRWYVLGDDDTVFFTENLVSVLGKFDHEEMYYVGGISESVEQDVMHSYGMAFGGGGFAVSHVLAKELSGLLDACLQRYGYFYGSDQRVAACLAELGVPLTRELGFHQFDIRGDAYGVLAAHPVAPLVSLHHLDYVEPLVPGKTREESVRSIFRTASLDQGRALQQSFGYDPRRKWSVSVSWGYTVQVYPWVEAPHLMARAFQTFKTWRSWQPGPFTFNTREWKSEPCEQPLVYFLESAAAVETARGTTLTRTVYKRRVVEKECRDKAAYREAVKIERVEVLAHRMGTQEWRKGPRRYCTEIDQRIQNRRLTVKLRKCRTGESFSPPP